MGDKERAREAALQLKSGLPQDMTVCLRELDTPSTDIVPLGELAVFLVRDLDQPVRLELRPSRFQLRRGQEVKAVVSIVNKSGQHIRVRARKRGRGGALVRPSRTFHTICSNCTLSIDHKVSEALQFEYHEIGHRERLTLWTTVRASGSPGSSQLVAWSELEVVGANGERWHGWVMSNGGVVEILREESDGIP